MLYVVQVVMLETMLKFLDKKYLFLSLNNHECSLMDI
jgi:hypothetical protein